MDQARARAVRASELTGDERVREEAEGRRAAEDRGRALLAIWVCCMAPPSE